MIKKNGKGKEYEMRGRHVRHRQFLFEGEYLDGKKWNGKAKEYDHLGQLEFEVEYLKGERKKLKNN